MFYDTGHSLKRVSVGRVVFEATKRDPGPSLQQFTKKGGRESWLQSPGGASFVGPRLALRPSKNKKSKSVVARLFNRGGVSRT